MFSQEEFLEMFQDNYIFIEYLRVTAPGIYKYKDFQFAHTVSQYNREIVSTIAVLITGMVIIHVFL